MRGNGFAWAFGSGIGLVGFAVLLLTLAIGGGWRDVTELQWASAVLGVPHPPGSPVYLELAYVATLLPFGSIAWRVNLLSALGGAMALAATYAMAWRLALLVAPRTHPLVRAILATMGPVVLIGSPAFRAHSTTAEVYSLQTLGATALGLGLLLWESHRPRDVRPGLVAIFVCAVASGIHVSFVFYLPAVLLCLGMLAPAGRRPRVVSLAAAAVVLGAAVFLYVPLRAAQSPSMNWGNPVTLERTYFHLLNKKDASPRREASRDPVESAVWSSATFATGGVVAETVQWGGRLQQYLAAEIGWIPELAGLSGLLGLALWRRSVASGALLGIAGLHAVFGIVVGQWASPTGYTPIYALLAAAAVIPVAGLIPRLCPRTSIAVLAAVTTVAAFGLPVAPRLFEAGARGDRGADELARAVFDEVPARGILLVAHYWPIVGFAREVEGFRSDVDVFFRNQIYGSQRMVVDEARHPTVHFPAPLPRQPQREDRLARMLEFLHLNHQGGRPIAWQSDADDLYFPALVPDGLLLSYRPGAVEPTEQAEPRIEAWLRSFDEGGSRRHWFVGEFGVEESLLPVARYAQWLASPGRLRCDEAVDLRRRIRELVPPGQDFRPSHNLNVAIQGCERLVSESSSSSASSALGE